MSADQAILFVRAKRPNSIQTRGQLLCVREFAQFLVPLRNVFSCAEPKASAVTLSQYLTRQQHLLHGYEARQMKNVPKIVQLVCRLLIDIAANRQAMIKENWLEIPDLTAEVEKTVSQQAIQQLGKEMRGKGIPILPCSSHPLSPTTLQPKSFHDQVLISDNELDPLWRRQNIESPLGCSHSSNRGLSYSDSNLYKLSPQQYLLENLKSNKPIRCQIQHSLSHGSLTACNFCRDPDFPPQDIITQESGSEALEDTRPTFLKKQIDEGHQKSSSDPSEQGQLSCCNDASPAFLDSSKMVSCVEQLGVDMLVGGGDRGNVTEVPLITLQSELSPESRRVYVAKALAVDLTDKDLSSKVSLWQVGHTLNYWYGLVSCPCAEDYCNIAMYIKAQKGTVFKNKE